MLKACSSVIPSRLAISATEAPLRSHMLVRLRRRKIELNISVPDGGDLGCVSENIGDFDTMRSGMFWRRSVAPPRARDEASSDPNDQTSTPKAKRRLTRIALIKRAAWRPPPDDPPESARDAD